MQPSQQAYVEALQERDVAKFTAVRAVCLANEQRAITPNRPVMFDGKPITGESTKPQLCEYMNKLAEHIGTGVYHWMSEGELHAVYMENADTLEVIC